MKLEEIDERLSDTESVLSMYEKRINKLEESKMEQLVTGCPDYSGEFQWIRQALLNPLISDDTVEIKQSLLRIAEQIQKKPRPAVNRYNFSLFPESDTAFYPKIFFGKVIPWMRLFVIVGGLFSLGGQAIEARRVTEYNREAERYVRVWAYMDEHGNKQVKKAMDKAWKKTFEESVSVK